MILYDKLNLKLCKTTTTDIIAACLKNHSAFTPTDAGKSQAKVKEKAIKETKMSMMEVGDTSPK